MSSRRRFWGGNYVPLLFGKTDLALIEMLLAALDCVPGLCGELKSRALAYNWWVRGKMVAWLYLLKRAREIHWDGYLVNANWALENVFSFQKSVTLENVLRTLLELAWFDEYDPQRTPVSRSLMLTAALTSVTLVPGAPLLWATVAKRRPGFRVCDGALVCLPQSLLDRCSVIYKKNKLFIVFQKFWYIKE